MSTPETRPKITLEKEIAFSPVVVMPGESIPSGYPECQGRANSTIIKGLMPVALTFMLLFGFAGFAGAVVTGPGAAWQYCRRITLSPVTPSADFQVKITLTTGTLGNPYSNINTDGSDLRFYDINNNACNYWMETWNRSGSSVVWVKVPASGAAYLYIYYGNASAAAANNGETTFDFFDDFTTSLGSEWSTITSGGSVTQSGTVVTLSNTNGGTVSLSNTSAFTPSSSSFLMETKHREVGYNRNRFYATTGTFGGSPISVGDYGYFSNQGTAQSSAYVFWGSFPGSTSVSNNTDYLTQWRITDGSTYNWYTYNYSTGTAVTNGSRTTTYGSNIRYISISVTEVASTSSIVDWIRLRKYVASEPAASIGSQVTAITASITSQTNVLCNGNATGSATVTATGGSGGYTYSWNSSPAQTTQTATNLPAGTYIATVTEASIGISVTATAVITEPAAVSATISGKTNITCFAGTDGTITVTATGGSETGYEFSKENGNAGTWTSGAGNPYTFTGLSANVPYKIRVKDSNGCLSPAIP